MYAMNFKQVGKNISNAIAERGITQQQLANELGISKQVMSKIINGKKAINVAELSQIASILGSTTDSLLFVESGTINHEPGLAFMGAIHDDEARHNVELLRNAIDQIHLLEDLTNE
ncbi:helix-turn-helix transcriptional regulator [Bacillaceae bacterium Marseille-Q3522]|nr:helix-turn-helix transcriptional regulator [Bacillaceae bacterium Marseille-Q3522]